MSLLSSLKRGPLHRAIFDISIFSVVINIFLLVPSIYMMQVYDRVLPAASSPTLFYLTLVAAGALLFLAVMETARSIYCQRVARRLNKQLSAEAFKACFNSPRAQMGDIQPLRDLASVGVFIASKGLTTLIDLPFSLLFVVLLFLVHPVLGIVTTLGALVMIAIVVLNQLATRRATTGAHEASASANLLAQTFVSNAPTVRSMGMLDNVMSTWGKDFIEAAVRNDRAGVSSATFASLSRASRMALQLAILATGAILVMRGEMTAGMIFASSTISGRALQPIDQLTGSWRHISDSRKAWTRLSNQLASQPTQGRDTLVLPAPAGSIKLKDVTWQAPGQKPGTEPVIKRVSLDIHPGEALALLGPSGAGKSSLAKLIAGVMPPTSGDLLLDGADYRTWHPVQFGASIGYLAQDVQLLPGTIAENISRFDTDASDEDITTAAIDAEAHDLIKSQTDGYQTRVGTAGSLSGGTRQRVGLARAFYRRPKVLVLDEPNSNLDAEGERALEAAIARAKAEGTTVVIVTHKPGIALRCDRAAVVKNGMIEALGPADSVLQMLAGAKKGQGRPSNGDISVPQQLSLVHESQG